MVETLLLGPLQTCCYLYSSDGEHLFVIDPGDQGELVIETIEKSGIQPYAVLLTHAHFDHVMACGTLKKRYPDIRIFASETEAAQMGETGKQHQREFLGRVPNLAGYYSEQLETLPEVTDFVQEGDRIPNSTLEVVELPGHTPGALGFYTVADETLFSGDALFRESIGRTDLPGGSQESLIRAIATKLFTLPDHTRVFPGHGEATTVEHEKQYNPFLRKRSVL